MGSKKNTETEKENILPLNQRLWTKVEARAYLNIPSSTFELYLAQGKIPKVRIGRHIRFIPEQLMAAVKKLAG